MKRQGILLAARQSGLPFALQALNNTLPVIPTHTVVHASQLLTDRRFSLIVGTLQFDDSRLFDLLPLAKATETPIIAIKLHHSRLSEKFIADTFHAAMLMGFDACIELQALVKKIGEEAAFESFHGTVLKFAKSD
jgi:hypothetical protein